MREIIRDFANQPFTDISTAFRERLAQFRGDTKQVDDVNYVVIKVVSDGS